MSTGIWGASPPAASDSAVAAVVVIPVLRPDLRRSPGAELLLERADLLGGLRELRAKAVRFPDLELVAQGDKGDLVLGCRRGFIGSIRITLPSPSILNISLVP